MRIAVLAALVALVLVGPVPQAGAEEKLVRPGYAVYRVLLDGGNRPPADPNNPNAPQPEADPTNSVVAVVPYSYMENRLVQLNKPRQLDTNIMMTGFKHKYGFMFPLQDKTQIQFYRVDNKSFEKELADAYAKWSNNRTYDNIHDLILGALGMGQVETALEWAGEYNRLPDGPKRTQRFKDFAKAFEGLPELLMTKEIKDPNKQIKNPKRLPANPETATWVERLSPSGGSIDSFFYNVIYVEPNQRAEAQRKGELLDLNFKAFYLLHAMLGIKLQVPKTKLLAVLSDSTNRVNDYRISLDGRPIVSDAFFSPPHNLLMLAPEPMDPIGNAFMNMTRAKYVGASRQELVENRMAIPPGKLQDMLRMQMLALADKFVSEAAENAAISREGCRQLMVASGILPQHLRLPIWLENGMSLFYQRSKGPVYVRRGDSILMCVPLVSGYGMPNNEQHRNFASFLPEFSRRPATTLKNVVSNGYYQGAIAGRDLDPKLVPVDGSNGNQVREVYQGVHPEDNSPQARAFRARLKQKADASAWALMYYLYKAEPMGLQKFYAELSKLPRDMKLDDEEVQRLLAKSFGKVKTGDEIDPAAMNAMGKNWIDYMKNVNFSDWEFPLEAGGGSGGNQGGNPGGGGGTPGGGGGTPGGGGGGGTPPPAGGGTPARPGG